MEQIKFAVVVTVFNEAGNVERLINTLINQSVMPKEIIFVDAGSTDGTVDIIKKKSFESDVKIKLISRLGFNRSRARNEGVKISDSEFIAVTDAGCEADPDWLKYLASGFVGEIEAVGGFYEPKIDKPIQKFFSKYTCVLSNEFLAETFLPSSRSIAFTKKIWEQVGGYPEQLDTCEDLIFAKKLFDTGKLGAEKNALVYWRQADGYGSFFRQISGYAKGDIEAGYWPHVIKIVSVWLRYILFVFLPWLTILYLAYILFKNADMMKKLGDITNALKVQIITDLAMIIGTLQAGAKWATQRQS